MTHVRDDLPHLGDALFLADSGLETELLFRQGVDLPEFAAFPLLYDDRGWELLRDYYVDHVEVARRYDVGIVLEAPTWRANRDWGAALGYDEDALSRVNHAAVDLLAGIRSESASEVVISGCIGPRGDAYRPDAAMSADEASAYHRAQVATFAESEADLVTAMTLTYADEAIGIVRAAESSGMPVVISFTVETDGVLPDGTSLGAAIEQVDAATGSYAACFMLNCAHPTHFDDVLDAREPWVQRLRAIRANASRASHADLDEAVELDDGDPVELGRQYAELRSRHPQLSVLGGCCGTDVRHVEQIARACTV